MKRTTVFLILSLIVTSWGFSQVNAHALGLRLNGSHEHFGTELSYQHGLGDANRLELDLGWRSHKNWSQLSLTGMYHWVWNLTGGLNWYVGPGARVGMYNGKDNNSDSFGVSVGGQLGLEYDLNNNSVPLLLSIDIRPMWNLLGDYGGFGYGSAFGIRYTF